MLYVVAVPVGDGLSLEDKFWQRVDVRGPDECWPWTRAKVKGYGHLAGWEPERRAHRIAFTLANGEEWDRSLLVRHTCDNPPCCNPRHLELGTQADNMADMVARGRSNKPRGNTNGRARLTETQVQEIRLAHQGGATQVELAGRYGVVQPHISRIVRAAAWPSRSDK